jgi:hypothetical protein
VCRLACRPTEEPVLADVLDESAPLILSGQFNGAVERNVADLQQCSPRYSIAIGEPQVARESRMQ